MAHIQQQEFCKSIQNKFPDFFENKFVLDIGSLDINGNNQEYFENSNYIGVDIAYGRNVDIVSKGHELGFPENTFDIIISTECFEHDQYYIKTIQNIYRMLKPGGLFIFTCATIGRAEHGTRRTTPEDAPLLQGDIEWSDYYKNLTETDIREVLDIEKDFVLFEFSTNEISHDLYFYGFKKGSYLLRDDYSFIIAMQPIKTELEQTKTELEQTKSTIKTINSELFTLSSKNIHLEQVVLDILNSRSWKITEPIREIANFLRYTLKISALKKIATLIYKDSFLIKKFLNEIKREGLKSAINKIRDKMHKEFILKSKNIEIQCSPNVADTNIITVLTTKHTIYVAHILKRSLENFNFSCNILMDEQSQYNNNLHIVICPQIFKKLPLHYIAYQMEQSVSSRWFTEQYFNVLKNSYAILDYSIKNIGFLQNNNVSYKQLFLLPIGIYKDYKNYLLESKQWDGILAEEAEVVFYGDANNERRKKYLNELNKHFKVKVVSEKFGNDLYKELLSSKVVVNIHYYENALLETTRIYECLSLGLNVVSEKSSDMDEHQNLNEFVNFTEIGNIQEMIDVIKIQLNKTIATNYFQLENAKFDFYLSRMLLSLDLISFEQLISVCEYDGIEKNKHNFYCLGLPENIERRISFEEDNKYSISIFDGLRHSKGWIGCGLSYKYLLNFAKAKDLEYIIICEDDVDFPDEFKEKLNEIIDYLSKSEHKWNMFSGLIADLNENTVISKVDLDKEKEFIYINKMTSTVFNIYHKSFFEKVINWDNTNLDVHNNTIDRYIESQGNLIVVTTNPFLVGHKEEQVSSIWHFQNTQYLDMFEATNKLLESKINEFKKQK